MGSLNSTGIYEYDSTDTDLGPTYSNRLGASVTETVQRRGNLYIGTLVQRLADTTAVNGALWYESDSGYKYEKQSGVWEMVGEVPLITVSTGWVEDTGFSAPTMYDWKDGTAVIRGTRLKRTGSSLAVSAGSNYTFMTLDAGVAPLTRQSVGAMSYGVAGNLVNGPVYVETSGAVTFDHWAANGTIATTGGIQNSINVPTFTVFYRI